MTRCFFVLMLAATVASFAQEPAELVTDRPDQTESSRTVPLGAVQVESGMVLERDRVGMTLLVHGRPEPEQGEVELSTTSLGVLTRVGVLPWLELRALGDFSRQLLTPSLPEYYFEQGTDESSNAFEWGLGGKIQVTEESGWVPESAIILHHLFIDGADDMLEEIRLCVSHGLPADFGIGYNVGAELDPRSGDLAILYTVAVGRDILDAVGAYVELFGDRPPGGEFIHSFDGGLTWLAFPNLQIDLSAGIGLSDAAPDWYFGTGVSFRVPD